MILKLSDNPPCVSAAVRAFKINEIAVEALKESSGYQWLDLCD